MVFFKIIYQIILNYLKKKLNALFNVRNCQIFLDFDFNPDISRDIDNE